MCVWGACIYYTKIHTSHYYLETNRAHKIDTNTMTIFSTVWLSYLLYINIIDRFINSNFFTVILLYKQYLLCEIL